MDGITELLERRIERVYPSKKMLATILRRKKIRVYQGFDPTSPHLHIGHLVGLLALRDFQRLGHEVIFLIGDFTGRIGDPTDKAQTRRPLTEKQVSANAKTYRQQAGSALGFTGKNPVTLRYNSTWNKNLTFADVIGLAEHLTVQQLLERDMFQARLDHNREIALSEFLYPLVQGYDSVAMEVDLEIGGTDQLFNMMIGRKLVRHLQKREKFVATTRLLTDANGKKIGKSEGNAINLTSPPHEFYGQIMSLTDSSILPCLRLITDLPMTDIARWEKELAHTSNPMPIKKILAFEVTKLVHGQAKAEAAQQEFENVFQHKREPKKTLDVAVKTGEGTVEILLKSGLYSSRGEVKRLIKQGGVAVNGIKITIPQTTHQPGDLIRAGKHLFIRVTRP